MAPPNGTSDKQKRKVLSRACEMCRKKKIKCSEAPAPCSNCIQYETECIFNYNTKPRKTPVRSGRRIDSIEARLKEIEAILKESAVVRSAADPIPTNDSSQLELGPSGLLIDDATTLLREHHAPKPSKVVAQSPPKELSSLSDGHLDCAVIAGRAMSATVLEPAGHLNSVQGMLSRAEIPLPPFNEAKQLSAQYFDGLNRVLPIFERTSFMSTLQDTYSSVNKVDPASWAAVNVVLALSHQMFANYSIGDSVNHESMTRSYLQNAMSVTDKLALREPDMLSVRALVGLAKVLHATSTPRAATMYVSMATRQIYHIGLHRSPQDGSLDAEALEWRHRLLWMAYAMDKDYSLRLDQPHTLNDQDLELRLPHWNPRDGLGLLPALPGKVAVNHFRLTINLAIIQSKIYTRLYSPQALRQLQDEDSRKRIMYDLWMMLESWRKQVPTDFDPLSLVQDFPSQSVIPMVILYLRFFNCLTMVHRLSWWKAYRIDTYKQSFDQIVETGKVCPFQILTIKSARSSLQLFNIIPHGNVPCMWLLVDYFISAMVILLAGIIYEFPYSDGRQDLQLVRPILAEVEVLAQHGDKERLEHIWTCCVELEKAASEILDRADAQQRAMTPEMFREATLQEDRLLDWLQMEAANTDIPTSYDDFGIGECMLSSFDNLSEV